MKFLFGIMNQNLTNNTWLLGTYIDQNDVPRGTTLQYYLGGKTDMNIVK